MVCQQGSQESSQELGMLSQGHFWALLQPVKKDDLMVAEVSSIDHLS